MPTPAAALRAMAEQTDDEEMQHALELSLVSRQSSEMKTSSYIPSREKAAAAASPAGGHNNAVQTLVDMFGCSMKQAAQYLGYAEGNVDRAAEMLMQQ